ncbi:hypothetical protein PVK06_017860 [Gossypium arboreum]|uniref:Receptor-like protein 12 n=1 Tax=Gossypium arboreum TaxID=29729 RepID=A0ABR0Q4M7_GOSAR|nr:hypothetical protein PVK06_017860 [Gossypium arboreum]
MLHCRPMLNTLEYLDLHSNKLNGPMDPIQEPNLVLLNLPFLDLSFNNLSGNIKSCMLVKLRNLSLLDLSHNNLLSLTSCNYGANSTLPMIIEFHFSSCNMQRFPSFLNASKYLQLLDLSNNQIHRSITKWEAEGWENLTTLNLFMNFLISVEKIPGKHLYFLELSSNSLRGPFPTPPQNLSFLLISNNELVGEIPSKICNLSFLSVLDLSKNKLGGTIPDCFGTFGNKLSMILRTLNLNGNQLEGSIPQSLKICFNLEVLDLGNNNINDTFPYWLDTLTNLEVLVLRSNRFHGGIQNFNRTFSFRNLQMIDLSRNEFTGHIPPELFENLKSMKDIQIPLANHFDTFSNDSFDGNSGLCGFPLSKKCGNNQELESSPSTVADDSETTLVWKIAAMGYGSGLVLGLSMGYIVFTTGKPYWLVKMIKRNPQERGRIHQNGRRKN